MADVDTSREAVERMAQTLEAEAQHFSSQKAIDGANNIAATLRALLAEGEAARMREALRKIAESEPWSGRAPLASIGRAALTSKETTP